MTMRPSKTAASKDPFVQLIVKTVGVQRSYRLSDVLKCFDALLNDLREAGMLQDDSET